MGRAIHLLVWRSSNRIEAERLVTTASVTPKTTNSNSLLPNTASIDIQQHVNSANSDNADIGNLTVQFLVTNEKYYKKL
jgi:hypothetical protein